MKFQHQQKGLFTFYREQEQLEQQIKQLRESKQLQNDDIVGRAMKKKSNNSVMGLAHGNKLTMQRSHIRDQTAGREGSQFRRYGQAVAIFEPKQSDGLSCSKNKADSPAREQLGFYLENKNLSLDFNNSKQPSYVKVKSHSKRKEKARSSQAQPYQQRSTKLPSLVKADLDQTRPPQYKNMYSGSLIRSHDRGLLRQARKGKKEGSYFREDRNEKHVVSYFEFNHDYDEYLQLKKKKELSMQQRKLLELLNRYRR